MSQSVIPAPSYTVDMSNEATVNVTVPTNSHCHLRLLKSEKTIELYIWTDFVITKGTKIATIPAKYVPQSVLTTYPYVYNIWAQGYKGVTISKDGAIKVSDGSEQQDFSSWTIIHDTWIIA